MNTIFRKIMLGLLVATLMLASLPFSSASAAGLNETATPPAPSTSAKFDRNTRLERVFARQNKMLTRVGKLYAQADLGFPKIQSRIDKAKANGLDVTQVQAAFDAFKKALTDARPLYNQAKTIADTHNGFDASGKVTDPTTARETVKSLREAGKQFKDAMDGTLKALHEAVKALRETKK